MAEFDSIPGYLRLPLKVASEVISAPAVIAPVFSAMLADYSKDAKSAFAKLLELFRSRLRRRNYGPQRPDASGHAGAPRPRPVVPRDSQPTLIGNGRNK